MSSRKWLSWIGIWGIVLACAAARAADMGTVFTYQGYLENPVGTPVTGINCDFRFGLWDAAVAGGQKGTSPQTVLAVPVDGGVFTAAIDFGDGAYEGSARWLEIEVQCPGDVGFILLSPRVEMTPAPYALALPGLYTEQNATSPNVIGGYSGNMVRSGVQGAAIGGGGNAANLNLVLDHNGTVGGGISNMAGTDDGDSNSQAYATVAGGGYNAARGEGSTVGGGAFDNANGWRSVVAGGNNNTANGSKSTVSGGNGNLANGERSTVGGGEANTASGDASTVGGGTSNQAAAGHATVGGGNNNLAAGGSSTVGGGLGDQATGDMSTVAGGWGNHATALSSAVGGGRDNNATGEYSTVPGGTTNTAGGEHATVGGGGGNSAFGSRTTVGGGFANTASGFASAVGGGVSNFASGYSSTIGGGESHVASGVYSTVPGGLTNAATGSYSLAAGQRAQANHAGTFVWSDSTTVDPNFFASTAADQFLINATGGVGINTNSPTQALDVTGNIHATGTIASGSSITIDGTAGSEKITSSADMDINVAAGRILRFKSDATAPSIIGGYSGNTITDGVIGATIAGGGRTDDGFGWPDNNRVTDDYGTIGGGQGNQAGDGIGTTSDRIYATVGGGSYNTAGGLLSTVGGGGGNTASGFYSTVGGGQWNHAGRICVGGTNDGWRCVVDDDCPSGSCGYRPMYPVVGGGYGNSAVGDSATVGGGYFNYAQSYSTVGGGSNNYAKGTGGVVGGGVYNTAWNYYTYYATDAFPSTISGGQYNAASGQVSTVGGGYNNLAGGLCIGGSNDNGLCTTYVDCPGGGACNFVWGATVAGGDSNRATAYASTIPGGIYNQAGGNYSFAAGYSATVRDNRPGSPNYSGDADGDEGTFVWADAQGVEFKSSGPNQFLIRAAGGVGMGTASATAPRAQLDVVKSGGTVGVFDRTTDDGTIVELRQAGNPEGTISVSGATVSYNAFTGSHYAWTDETIARGTLVTLTGVNRSSHENPESERIYGIGPTTKANDPQCLGAYLGLLEPAKPQTSENPHQVMAVGNGDMWVVDTGRNIEPGQYLISSDLKGHAMLDDPERFPIGYVIARAGEPVDWSTVNNSVDGHKHKKISVFFESFERGSAAQQRKIEALESRVAALERAVSANAPPSRPVSLASIGGFAIPALALLGFVGLVIRGRSQNGGGR